VTLTFDPMAFNASKYYQFLAQLQEILRWNSVIGSWGIQRSGFTLFTAGWPWTLNQWPSQ